MGKRTFDILFSAILLTLLFIPMLIIWLITSISLKSNGIFFQIRIGQYGKPFTIYKYKSLSPSGQFNQSNWGLLLRNTKVDELPQLINVLKGDMSFVGPRPDIDGYYNLLQGENRKILELKPGLTSEASLKYFNEELLLREKRNKIEYNRNVIFPDKVRLNLKYYYNRSFFVDLKIIVKTIERLFVNYFIKKYRK